MHAVDQYFYISETVALVLIRDRTVLLGPLEELERICVLLKE